MAKSYKEINQDQRQFGSAYRKASPDTMNAFLALHKAAMVEGAVSIKHKELIATGIAIAARCDGCIGAHVAAAIGNAVVHVEDLALPGTDHLVAAEPVTEPVVGAAFREIEKLDRCVGAVDDLHPIVLLRGGGAGPDKTRQSQTGESTKSVGPHGVISLA